MPGGFVLLARTACCGCCNRCQLWLLLLLLLHRLKPLLMLHVCLWLVVLLCTAACLSSGHQLLPLHKCLLLPPLLLLLLLLLPMQPRLTLHPHLLCCL
jgi:hypothetical protein